MLKVFWLQAKSIKRAGFKTIDGNNNRKIPCDY